VHIQIISATPRVPLGWWFLLFVESDIHLLEEPIQMIDFAFSASPETIRGEAPEL
jgi:hypothetical protein